ncbi:hypothetical protein SNEBB_001384 [Seison nebaliae]|nr:hypothetical protein SNEBB_001384 [Seison nebaliae]
MFSQLVEHLVEVLIKQMDNILNLQNTCVILDIGTSKIKCGLKTSLAPSHVIDFTTTSGKSIREIRDEKEFKKEFRRLMINILFMRFGLSKERTTIIIIDSLLSMEKQRRWMVWTLLKKFKINSLTFIQTEIAPLYTLARPTGIVIDCGYDDMRITPVVNGYVVSSAIHYSEKSSRSINKLLRIQLKKHAFIKLFSSGELVSLKSLENFEISQKTIEDIKIRCCFVASHIRGKIFAANRQSLFLKQTEESEEKFELEDLDKCEMMKYHMNEGILEIPGMIRELIYELVFNPEYFELYGHEREEFEEKDEEVELISQLANELSLPEMIMESLIKSPIDNRIELANNIVVIGGMGDAEGFSKRILAESYSIVNDKKYSSRLSITRFAMHKTPTVLALYAAWLGAKLFASASNFSTKLIKKYHLNEEIDEKDKERVLPFIDIF